jgi:hypothetical protein
LPKTLINALLWSLLACVLGASLAGCGAGSGIKEPDQYAPPPKAGDRVRFGEEGSGGERKTRKLPQDRWQNR